MMRVGRRTLALLSICALGASAAIPAAPAHARRPLPDFDFDQPVIVGVEDPGLVCLASVTGSMRATPDRVDLGQSTTFSWTTARPSACSWARIHFSLQREAGREPVNASGTRTYPPIASETVSLIARYGDRDLIIATALVSVTLPQAVYIDANHLGPQLVQALRSTDRADRTVTVANGVEIDLTRWVTIPIAPGVTLRGGRGGIEPGPRLYTRWRLEYGLFLIDHDNVRITGLRIAGPDLAPVSDDVISRGILVRSSVDVEIDNNEIYGWTGVGIEVQGGTDPISTDPPYAVRIHDNYFHHNQHFGGNGYGVSTRYGGYARIECNVFDWNRHAIAADGRIGSGYAAHSNLVLENGGVHQDLLVANRYTHQFDAHGTDTCWGISHNCGQAGYAFYISHNTFLYTEDNAIRLRGTPQLRPYGMFVEDNVFAHDSLGDAVTQTETGLYLGSGNVTGNVVEKAIGICDFDGDLVADDLMTTGVTWWYASGGQAQWRHLHTSSARLPEMMLGYFDGDWRCDISVGGVLYSGGRPAPPPPPPKQPGSIGGIGVLGLR